MATINKTTDASQINFAIQRGQDIPLDQSEVWYSLEEAENYAKNNGTAYVGQTIKVVDEVKGSVEAFVIADTSGKLEPIGGTPGFAYYSAEAEKASGYIGGGQIDRKLRTFTEQIAEIQDTLNSIQMNLANLVSLPATVASQGLLITSLQNSISRLDIRIADWEDDGKNNNSNSATTA